MPKGAKLVNVVTMFSKNETMDAGESRLRTSSALPVRGSISTKDIEESSADNTQINSMRKKNKIAGSGSLFPARSTKSRKRVISDFLNTCSFVLIGLLFNILQLSSCLGWPNCLQCCVYTHFLQINNNNGYSEHQFYQF